MNILERLGADLRNISDILSDKTRRRILLFLFENCNKEFTAEEIGKELGLKISNPAIRKHLRVLAGQFGNNANENVLKIRFGDEEGVFVDIKEDWRLGTKTGRRGNRYKISDFGLRWIQHFERRALGDKEWTKPPKQKVDDIVERLLDGPDDYDFISFLTGLIKEPEMPKEPNPKTMDRVAYLERRRERNNALFAKNLGLLKEETSSTRFPKEKVTRLKLTEYGKGTISKIEDRFKEKERSRRMGIFERVTLWLAFYNPGNMIHARVFYYMPAIGIPILAIGMFLFYRMEPSTLLAGLVTMELFGALSILWGFWMIHFSAPLLAAYLREKEVLGVFLWGTFILMGLWFITMPVFTPVPYSKTAAMIVTVFLFLYVVCYLWFVGVSRTSLKWRLKSKII